MTALFIILLAVAVAAAEITKQGVSNRSNCDQDRISGTTVARLVTTITNDYI